MKQVIGLNLAFKGNNYGALWQAFATQQIIKRFGYETEIINYIKKDKHEYIHCPEAYFGYIVEFLNYRKWKKEIINKDDVHIQNELLRNQVADEFRKNRLENIFSIQGLKELENHCKEYYSAVLVGSDQLWAPMISFTYISTLRFAPTTMKKISYATSLGVSEYPRYAWKKAKDFWSNIDYLSVREKTGANIIKRVSGLDAKVVLDPTYLFTKKEWESFVPKNQVLKAGYVLCFLIGDNPAMKKAAKKYAIKFNLRLVSIMSNEVVVDDNDYSDEIIIGKSPEEFINIIRNADCIFTDSFHGFAFSVINEKQVYVTYRIRKGTASRNSRIDDILTLFDIQNRLIINPEGEFDMDNKIDYIKLNAILEERRSYSLSFLEKALKD